ncbi:hypothetical protein [Paracoccus aminovorans]|uniref:hypothetical protein n=1 Tax=Paracoccus aminovorans TaxID=34004 RepID=UPI00078394DD|nr:hypothetical protein [Paracoccus aminovorans]MDQ7777685.1 hypothetical protein [Paracoccus aminovorans]
MMVARSIYIPRRSTLDRLSDVDRVAVLDAYMRKLEEEEERCVTDAKRDRQMQGLQNYKRRLVEVANDYGLWLD